MIRKYDRKREGAQKMKKNILIANSNRLFGEELKRWITRIRPYQEIAVISESGEVYEYLMNNTVDMFILDAVLHPEKPGDISGIRLAEQIREIAKYVLTPVIFVTSKEDPVRFAYEELNCLGYFVRPFETERFMEKVRKGLHYRTSRNEEKMLLFRKDSSLYPVRVKDIVYIESASPGMFVHTTDGRAVEVMYKTYNCVLQEADSECLMQCSRSVVVNRDYILNLDFPTATIVLKYKLGRVAMGSTYKKLIRDEFSDSMF